MVSANPERLDRRLPAWVALAALFAACSDDSSTTASPAGTAPAPVALPAPAPTAPAAPQEQAPGAASEQSVRPGANAQFLSPELDVEQWVRTFEGESREIAAQRTAIAAALRLAPGMAVADVGSGTGLFLSLFSAGVGAEGKVYAVDLSPKFLEYLRRRVVTEGLANVEVVECNDHSTELAPGSIDVAFVCDTYHHFEYPRSMLADLRRAVRPGGSLVIVDFERIEGVSRQWVLDHVRAGKEQTIAEVRAAGFGAPEEVSVEGLKENYLLRFPVAL
jgi:SAM-dependent methyltransferase